MLNIFLVASGGATGALLRFFITNFFKTMSYYGFYGTLTVNILGSFLIGYLISLGYHKNFSENFIKYFLMIGLLGSFTTFSAFSYEAVELVQSNKFFLCILYVFSSLIICIVAAYLGMYINKI